MKQQKPLCASKEIEIRFSEVDSMKVVWHGSYPLYFEDAREHFGKVYGLGYDDYLNNHYYAPIVEMTCKYKRPLAYGQKARIDIFYQPTESAKVVFDYEIHNAETNQLIATGRTIQVFTDLNYQLVLTDPPFYEAWKEKWIKQTK